MKFRIPKGEGFLVTNEPNVRPHMRNLGYDYSHNGLDFDDADVVIDPRGKPRDRRPDSLREWYETHDYFVFERNHFYIVIRRDRVEMTDE